MKHEKKLDVNLQCVFVPLPPEQRAAWEYAMQIISKYMDLAAREKSVDEQAQSKETGRSDSISH